MQTSDVWTVSPPRPVATSAEVHVWRSSLSLPIARVRAFERTLAPDERARAHRFVHEKDRDRFIVSRGVLREILGRYLGRDPRLLRFDYNPFGKPMLSADGGLPALSFNVSHADEIALCAVTRGRETGVDIERIRPDVGVEDVAARCLSKYEIGTLRGLPASCRLEAFFACWTRKEAYLKAKGGGLSLPLDGFDVSLAPEHPAALLGVHGDAAEANRWSLRALFPGQGYVAALAVEGHGWHLRCWQGPAP